MGEAAINLLSPRRSVAVPGQREQNGAERLRLDTRERYNRSAAKTASGSEPETLPTAIHPKRLTSAPIKNEIAASGTKPNNRRTSASGPVKVSPMRMSQPELCSCIARSAAPCLLIVSQTKSADSTAAAKNPIALSGA